MTTAAQLRNAGAYVPPHVQDHEAVTPHQFVAVNTMIRKKPKLSRRRFRLLHPFDGEPCSFEQWKRAEIARIMDKGD